jgi:hypothetical protein
MADKGVELKLVFKDAIIGTVIAHPPDRGSIWARQIDSVRVFHLARERRI